MSHVRVLVCASLALLTACGGGGGGNNGGGGGGGGGLNNTLYSGNYFTLLFGGNSTVGTYARMQAGGLAALGNGSGTWTLSLDNQDNVFNPLVALPVTNLVAGDGTFTMNVNATIPLTGGIPAAGDVPILASVTAGNDPSICIGVKSVGAFNTGTLTGSYHFGFLNMSGTGAHFTALSRVNFDGLGTWAFTNTVTFNNNGTLTPNPPGLGGAYSVNASGGVALSGPPGSFTGAVVNGGNLVVLAGNTVPGNGPSLMVLIRAGAGLSTGTFFGNYWVVGLKCQDPSAFPGPPTPFTRITAFQGTTNANGAGALTYVSTTENLEGVISTPSGPDDYLVQPDGTLVSSDLAGAFGGPFRVGGVSPDGRFAFLTGEVVTGSPPILFLFVKK